jgi:N-acetylmuramoyl-L-alanine amidase
MFDMALDAPPATPSMAGMPATSPPRGGQERLLVPGDAGDAITDLQQRLTKLGHPCSGAIFDEETEQAVRAFQRQRGLRENGVVDRQSWSAIVEAGYELGDRPLYRRRPMLRGDDVAELQRRLSQLGFDSGRIDGIFGDETVDALTDFQRNAGLTVDGIFGRRTLADLSRLTIRKGAGDLVSPLRERLLLATGGSGSLAGRRIAIGEGGGFAAGAASVCRALERAGATAIALQHPDASYRASEANASEVDCLVDLHLVADRTDCSVAFYRGFRYESMASRHLAELVQELLPAALGLDDGGTKGMALPVLRETRMPAIEVELGSPVTVVRRTADLARIIEESLGTWVASSWD